LPIRSGIVRTVSVIGADAAMLIASIEEWAPE
jgi:hypothetical protein